MNSLEHSNQNSPTPEVNEGKESILSSALKTIGHIKSSIAKKLGLSGPDLTATTDEALIDLAIHTIDSANADGVVDQFEQQHIQQVIETVVIEGALEAAGLETTTQGNPIINLVTSGHEPEVVDAIEDLHANSVTLPSGASVAELAAITIDDYEKSEAPTYKKVGEQKGSNDGGEYENTNGERVYAKFYENPDQARVEYVANAIYKKLGIKSVHSELAQIDGRFAIISPMIQDAATTSQEQQKSSPDVQNGFIADAYLANWDVVGMVHDNIIQGVDGEMYRIDNGGSMTFRAQGGPKDFSPNDIPELTNMRNPNYPAGKVFEDITQDEMKTQAKHLVDNLSTEAIDEIIQNSGLEGEVASAIKVGLLGRREFLIDRFRLNEAENNSNEQITVTDNPENYVSPDRLTMAGAIEALMSSGETTKSGETSPMLPMKTIICDKDHIKDQQVNIIHNKESNELQIFFTIAPGTLSVVQDMMENLYNTGVSGGMIESDYIRYSSISDPTSSFSAAPSYSITPNRPDGQPSNAKFSVSRTPVDANHNRASIGLVKITISDPLSLTSGQIESSVQNTLDWMKIPGAFEEVDSQTLIASKEASYRLQHKIPADQIIAPEVIGRLVLKEIAPEHYAWIEEGKHTEYGDCYMFHKMSMGIDQIPLIHSVLTGGLVPTANRLKRGLFYEGMSSTRDMDTGGANSIFARTAFPSTSYNPTSSGGVSIIFSPRLQDRTDAYYYLNDRYGSTEPSEFAGRPTPSEYYSSLAIDHFGGWSNNEAMFPNGIGSDYIQGIILGEEPSTHMITEVAKSLNVSRDAAVNLWSGTINDIIQAFGGSLPDDISKWIADDPRFTLINGLKAMGMTSLNGRRLEDVVHYILPEEQIVRIANGNPLSPLIASPDNSQNTYGHPTVPPPQYDISSQFATPETDEFGILYYNINYIKNIYPSAPPPPQYNPATQYIELEDDWGGNGLTFWVIKEIQDYIVSDWWN